MKKTLAILLLVAPTIVFANTMQSPEQSIKGSPQKTEFKVR